MESLGKFICQNCNMAFHSAGLLNKHKAKFCIGTDLKDPISLWKGQRGQTEKEAVKTMHPTRARTPDFILLKEKRNRQVDQSESDQGKPQDNDPNNTVLNKLTEELQKLRFSFEQRLSGKHTEVSEEQFSLQQRNDKLRHKDHEQRLADIKAHNLQLEKDREDIEQRLAELASREKTAHLDEVLQGLRDQEQRNEEVLHQLSSHICSIKGPTPSEVPSKLPEEKKTQQISTKLISSVDGPLSAQIRALRLAYMQSGCSDPEVLAHMHDLQAEALTLEQTKPTADGKTKTKRMKSSQRVLDSDVLAVEQENQRLEEEILRMQMARERHKGEHGLTDIQKNHIHQIKSLQAEINFLSRGVEKGRERRPHYPQPPLPVFPGPSTTSTHPPLDQSSQISDPTEALGAAPYDPVAGIVIFYDLVIGIEATLGSVRLLAGLYYNGQNLGQTATFPPVQCQPAGPLLSTKSPGNYAILAFKQPMQSIQPSPSLSLVVEIQSSKSLDFYKDKIEGFTTFGWAKFKLFDQRNQVCSGCWRLPFQSLPVQASLSSDQLNSTPQILGITELCLQVANAHDGGIQNLAEIDLNNINQYKHLSMGITNADQLPDHTIQPSSNPLPSSQSLMGHVEEASKM